MNHQIPPGFGGPPPPPADNRQNWDIGNPILAQCPANLSVSQAVLGGKQLMILTIRTQSATQTVLLDPADAKAWADQIKQIADKMSVSGLITGTAGGSLN